MVSNLMVQKCIMSIKSTKVLIYVISYDKILVQTTLVKSRKTTYLKYVATKLIKVACWIMFLHGISKLHA